MKKTQTEFHVQTILKAECQVSRFGCDLSRWLTNGPAFHTATEAQAEAQRLIAIRSDIAQTRVVEVYPYSKKRNRPYMCNVVWEQ